MSERITCDHIRAHVETFDWGTWAFCLDCDEEGARVHELEDQLEWKNCDCECPAAQVEVYQTSFHQMVSYGCRFCQHVHGPDGKVSPL